MATIKVWAVVQGTPTPVHVPVDAVVADVREEVFKRLVNTPLPNIHLFRPKGREGPDRVVSGEKYTPLEYADVTVQPGDWFVVDIDSPHATGRCVEEPYPCTLLSCDDFTFDAPLPVPFLLPRSVYTDAQMEAAFDASGFSGSRNGVAHRGWRSVSWLTDFYFPGTSEFHLISRTDTFIQLMSALVGNLKTTRNQNSSATMDGNKLDVTVYTGSFPPLVLIEEKSDDGQLDTAVAQVEKSLALDVPFYGALPYVICIAVTRTQWRFWAHPRFVGARKPPALLVTGAGESCTLLPLVRVFINIARWFRWVMESTAALRMTALAMPLNYVFDRPMGKTVKLTFSGAIKVYPRDDALADRLTAFYADCRDVPYLETAYHIEKTQQGHRFYLSPLGTPALFVVNDERSLALAIYCVLRALEGMHQHGWVHNDVRWENIVYRPPGFFLIDCEFVWRSGEGGFTANIKQRYPQAGARCEPFHDLYRAERLLGGVAESMVLSRAAFAFSRRFARVRELTASQLLRDRWFAGCEELLSRTR